MEDGMKTNVRQASLDLGVSAMVVAILVTGCATSGTEPAKAAAPAKATTAAKPVQAPKPVAMPKPPPPPPAKPKLAMPQVEAPAVPAVSIPPFDWQNAAPVKRADVLAEMDKKPRTDEFDHMIRLTDMDGKQLAGFLAAVKDRLDRLAAWEGTDKGKRREELRTKAIPAAQEGTDEAKLKALVVESRQLDAEYGALRTAVRAMVMGVLSPDQQRVWVGHAVMGAVGRSLRGVQLDDAQRAKALALCVETAKGLVKDDTVAKDPYLGNLLKGQEALIAKTADRVKTEVLTKEQRNALTPKN
jgi:hypothetical protein